MAESKETLDQNTEYVSEDTFVETNPEDAILEMQMDSEPQKKKAKKLGLKGKKATAPSKTPEPSHVEDTPVSDVQEAREKAFEEPSVADTAELPDEEGEMSLSASIIDWPAEYDHEYLTHDVFTPFMLETDTGLEIEHEMEPEGPVKKLKLKGFKDLDDNDIIDSVMQKTSAEPREEAGVKDAPIEDVKTFAKDQKQPETPAKPKAVEKAPEPGVSANDDELISAVMQKASSAPVEKTPSKKDVTKKTCHAVMKVAAQVADYDSSKELNRKVQKLKKFFSPESFGISLAKASRFKPSLPSMGIAKKVGVASVASLLMLSIDYGDLKDTASKSLNTFGESVSYAFSNAKDTAMKTQAYENIVDNIGHIAGAGGQVSAKLANMVTVEKTSPSGNEDLAEVKEEYHRLNKELSALQEKLTAMSSGDRDNTPSM